MILVDKDIKRRKDEIFIENYNEESVQPISYDIHIEKIINQDNNDNEISYCLESHEAVMIKCIEKISVPKDLIIRVENKNSLIRLGLTITSPVYNPGHSTPIYIRVENISGNDIILKKGMTIAQMIFEELSKVPDTTYDNKKDASYNDEDTYRGLGKYSGFLEKQIKRVQTVTDNLEKKETSIYTNILTMMGIFVSIFSMIVINFSAINQANFNRDFILTINISLCIVITVFIGLILIFLNKFKSKLFNILYIIVLVILIIILLCIL